MSTAIKIGIAGYGNLGRGVELAIAQNSDMVLTGIFTRRDPASVQPLDITVPVRPLASVADYKSDIDVLILCGGSKNDLPEQGPALAALFNIVDSFDTHAKIPDYFASVDKVAAASRTTALISAGWDPGLFSLNRLYGETRVLRELGAGLIVGDIPPLAFAVGVYLPISTSAPMFMGGAIRWLTAIVGPIAVAAIARASRGKPA